MNTAEIPRLPRQLILLGAPLALVLLELTHPHMPSQANASCWVAIHVIQLPLFGLFALAVLLLLDGTHNIAATTSRVALGVFVIFYTFLDSTSGIAVGILLENQRGLSAARLSGAAQVLAGFWADPVRQGLVNIGYAGMIVGVLAACIALAQLSGLRLRVPLGILVFGGLLMAADWNIEVPGIGQLHVIGWVICVVAAACGLFLAAAPRLLLVVPLALLVAVPLLLVVLPDDPNGTIGMIAGGLAVVVAVLLAVRSGVLLSDGPNAHIYPLVALAITVAVLGWDHSAPFGPVGFTCLFIAAVWLDLRRSAAAPATATAATVPETGVTARNG